MHGTTVERVVEVVGAGRVLAFGPAAPGAEQVRRQRLEDDEPPVNRSDQRELRFFVS
jgi:hypothetical protein